MENYFVALNNINVNDKTEKKNGLTYLSWAYAWGEIKKLFPNAQRKVYEREDGVNYFTDGKTAWVKTSVTINDIEHIDYLPIMDTRNRSIPLENITSFDVNKTIQRSITKACALHGLGLYIYAGEDLPVEPVFVAPTPEQLQELEEVGGSLDKCATYYKKPADQVTSKEVQALIDRKKKLVAKTKVEKEADEVFQ